MVKKIFSLLILLAIAICSGGWLIIRGSGGGGGGGGVAPILNFSDITSGPDTGLGDGYGSGAIVTIWGNNLGSSQGASTISVCGTSPAYVLICSTITEKNI